MSKKISIYDTTLRDGEQAPGNSMSLSSKIRVASKLEELGVDTIEAGFPVISRHDFLSVASIAKMVSCKVSAFARSKKTDIDLAGKALQKARRGQIEILGSGSIINLTYKRGLSIKEGMKEAKETISYALEDAARGEIEYLRTLSNVAIEAGAAVIVFGDTVGYATPAIVANLVGELKKSIPADVSLSIHCHNDLGLAIANSLAAIENGAQEVQVTVNGIGERCGNTQLEALVMALYVHKIGRTGIKKELMLETSQLVTKAIGRKLAPEVPIIGGNAFSTEAGMHQDGILKNPEIYQIFDPKIVGRRQEFILGRHSGNKGVKFKLKEIGLAYDDGLIEEAVAFLKKTRHAINNKDLERFLQRRKTKNA